MNSFYELNQHNCMFPGGFTYATPQASTIEAKIHTAQQSPKSSCMEARISKAGLKWGSGPLITEMWVIKLPRLVALFFKSRIWIQITAVFLLVAGIQKLSVEIEP